MNETDFVLNLSNKNILLIRYRQNNSLEKIISIRNFTVSTVTLYIVKYDHFCFYKMHGSIKCNIKQLALYILLLVCSFMFEKQLILNVSFVFDS